MRSYMQSCFNLAQTLTDFDRVVIEWLVIGCQINANQTTHILVLLVQKSSESSIKYYSTTHVYLFT